MSKLFDTTLREALGAYDLVPPVELFALPNQGATNAGVGIHSGSGAFIAKTYAALHNRASLEYEHRLLAWLAETRLSFAVPMPVPARDGALLVQGPHGSMAIMPWLPGECLDPYRLDHAELLGAAIGELQTTMRQYPAAPRPGNTLFGALFDFPLPAYEPFGLSPARLGLPAVPAHDELLGWWREEAARLQTFVQGSYRALPWQVCHNDVAPANVLVDAGRVSAVLDFEFATPAPRALDIAMGLRMTMRVWENPEPWDVIHRFFAGYGHWQRMTETEVAALPLLIRLRSAIPILWRLGRAASLEHRVVVLRGIEYLRNLDNWLASYEHRFVEAVARAVL